MSEWIIRSARVVVDGRLEPASVHVHHGRIARVAAFDDVPVGAPVHEAGNLVVMAGVVDSHVHVNEPGRTEWEGFHTATRAAAAGGVTTLVDMPLNSIPATTSVPALLTKAEALHGRGFVDVGLWGGAVPGNANALPEMVRAGALGFKCFMVDSGVDEFPHVNREQLELAMQTLSALPVPLLVHAELPGPLEAAKAALDAEPLRDVKQYWRYVRSRPPAAEDEAIALLIELCTKTRARTHVVHLSSAQSLDQLRRAREAGLPFSAETTPHYLRLFAESIPDGHTEFKCAPPIREQANREALWRGLHEGTLAMVVTDHSPCTPELKRRELGDFEGAWGGIASLQFGLPIVWTEARARGVGLPQLSRWLSAEPAALAGLRTKGVLAAGRDADLVVWDPEASFEVRREQILHRHAITPYLGQTLFGAVKETYLRGQRVFGDGQVAERPMGSWLHS
jgi:allantoinase